MSKETLKRALMRALLAFITGSLSAFAMMPVNLDDPKRYFTALVVGMIAGGIMGLQKLIKGTIKYN